MHSDGKKRRSFVTLLFATGDLRRSAIDELAYLKSNLTKMRLSHIDCKRFYKDLMI